MDEVRRVLAEPAALVQGLAHERDVALFEIANAAVDELGAAARRALAEVVLLEQRDAVTASRSVDGHPDARRAAADDDDVPRLALAVESRRTGVRG